MHNSYSGNTSNAVNTMNYTHWRSGRPSLWALRRVGFLMDQIRLNGENAELKNEVVRLGKQYGIVSPYTSYLVVEDGLAQGHRPAGPGRLREGRSSPGSFGLSTQGGGGAGGGGA